MDKNIPFSKEAEQRLLASIIVQPDILLDLVSKLDVDDFFVVIHKNIYQALINLNKENKQIEYVSILKEFKKVSKVYQEEDLQYITELTSLLASGYEYLNFYQNVKEYSNKRKLIKIAEELISKGYNPEYDFSTYVEYAEKSVNDLIEKRELDKLSSLSEVWTEVGEKTEEIKKIRATQIGGNFVTSGLSTGFINLDEATAGLQKEELIILAARPGVGKSAFAMQLALNIAHTKTVVFFSLEMSTIQLGQRVIANLCEIPLNDIKSANLTADQSYYIKHGLSQYSSYNLYFDDKTNGTIDDIRAKCRRIQQEKGLDVIIIDYLQLLHEPGVFNRQEEVSKISRRLKQLAREFKVPIVALSQLSREVEKRENKMPILADLRESGSIEQDADLVVFLYSADKYKKQGEQKDNIIQLIIQKNRQGSAPQTLNYKFFGHLSKYEETENREVN